MSAVPPGAKPTTSRTGRLGQGSCAQARVGSAVDAAAALRKDRLSIIGLPVGERPSTRDQRSNGGRERKNPLAHLAIVESVTMPKVHRADDATVPQDRCRNDGPAAGRLDGSAVRKGGAQLGKVARDENGMPVEYRLTPGAALVLFASADRITRLAAV